MRLSDNRLNPNQLQAFCGKYAVALRRLGKSRCERASPVVRLLRKVGARIRTLRRARGLSQEQLAFEAGVDRAISDLERGLHEVGVARLEREGQRTRHRLGAKPSFQRLSWRSLRAYIGVFATAASKALGTALPMGSSG
jgi:DNA-binding XRE family transcriptional regulator